jgi:hypothetical protein
VHSGNSSPTFIETWHLYYHGSRGEHVPRNVGNIYHTSWLHIAEVFNVSVVTPQMSLTVLVTVNTSIALVEKHFISRKYRSSSYICI